MSALDEEMALVIARFRALAEEWMLDRSEAAAILDTSAALLDARLAPMEADGPIEHRMRILLEIRNDLPDLGITEGEVSLWLRERLPGYDPDADGIGERLPATPLGFMAGPLVNLRALRDVLRGRRR